MQSALGRMQATDLTEPSSIRKLMTGRITSPVDPRDPAMRSVYDEYITRCIKTNTVDVLVDHTGQYLSGCLLMQAQGNGREGSRRMPRFPRAISDKEVSFGDSVVVAFLHSNPSAPIVLGFLIPPKNAKADFEALESDYVTVRDPNEWMERHDHLDTSEIETLGSHTMSRDSGIDRSTEHVVDAWIDAEKRRSHVIARDTKARSLEYEHYVQTGEAEAGSVRVTDDEATTLRLLHAVKDADGKGKVTIESIAAKVLRLQLEVENMGKLLLSATNGEQLLLQQDTPQSTATLAVSGKSTHLALAVEDKSSSATATLTLAADGVANLMRVGGDKKASHVLLDDDGSVLLRSTTGGVLSLADGMTVLTSRKAKIVISESGGIAITSAGGTMVTIQDDAVVLSADKVTVASPVVHLSGQVRSGPSGRGGFVPDTSKLYTKLNTLSAQVSGLLKWANLHTHAGPSPTPLKPVAIPTTTFAPAAVTADSLKSFKGD